MGTAKKKRQRTYKSLKAELDKAFSIYIRQRGADENGFNSCVSCGVRKHWSELQAGHYYSRVFLGTRYHETNTFPQCPVCNVLRRGNMASYARFMYATYPQSMLDELDALHKKVVKFDRSDLEALIVKYSNLV